MMTPEEHRRALEALKELRQRWDYDLSELKKVHEQLLSIGQMQAILLVLLKRQKNLKPDELNLIAFADRSMRALDLPLQKDLRALLSSKYKEAGLPLPDFEIAGPGSSLPRD